MGRPAKISRNKRVRIIPVKIFRKQQGRHQKRMGGLDVQANGRLAIVSQELF